MIAFVLKRLMRRPGLALLALLGIILPLGVLSSASLFAGGVDRVVLQNELATFSQSYGRPPLGIRFYAYGTPSTPISVTLATDALGTATRALVAEMGLPATHSGYHISSINFSAQTPGSLDTNAESGKPLYVQFVAYPDIGPHIETVGGTPFHDTPAHPAHTSDAAAPPVPVWLHANLAERLNVQVGDHFPCQAAHHLEGPEELARIDTSPLTVTVEGLWQPTDPEHAFWFDDPNTTLETALLVHRADYVAHIEARQLVKVHRVNWDIVLDASQASPSNVERYLSGFDRAFRIMKHNIPNTLYDNPPLPPLHEFTRRNRVLMAMLLSFNMPALGFVLFFLALSAAIIARGQRRDTVMLLSRGVRNDKLYVLVFIEELLLSVIGYPLGMGLGLLIARGMGYTKGFLAFTARAPLPLSLADANFMLSVAALGIPILMRLWATYQHTRGSIAEADEAHARPLHAPFWMRYGLDFLLLIPTAYIYQRLVMAGSLAALAPNQGEELYETPLLILLPAMFILSSALLSIRIFPLLMRGLEYITDRLPGTSAYIAFHHLERQWQHYVTPLLLTTVSLALGTYAYSMALSLDTWLVDRTYYRVGADLFFSPLLEGFVNREYRGPQGSVIVGGDWIPPVDTFRELPGVLDATRIGRYRTRFHLVGGEEVGYMYALDRADFAQVAWFRDDFANENLGALMNRLAQHPQAVLVPASFLHEHFLRVGDTLAASITLDQGLIVDAKLKIVGTYDLFPTIYPEDDVTLIGNLNYLNHLGGLTVNHDILLRTDRTVPGRSVFEAVSQTGIEAESRTDAQATINKARARHERVGVFGTLSLGFITALGMAALALVIYCQTSLQDRLWWLTVLHAIGITRKQLIRGLIIEQAILMTYSVVISVALGVAASHIFVPFMRIAEETGVPQPPLVPMFAMQETWLLALGFAGVMMLVQVSLIMVTFVRARFTTLKVYA